MSSKFSSKRPPPAPPRPMSAEVARRFPDDVTIRARIAEDAGVVELIALHLGVPVEDLSHHIAGNADLARACTDEAARVHGFTEANIRRGVAKGDLGWTALRLKQMHDAAAKGGAGTDDGRAQPIDFTREVRDVSEFSDAELLAAIRHREGCEDEAQDAPSPAVEVAVQAVEVAEPVAEFAFPPAKPIAPTSTPQPQPPPTDDPLTV